MKIKKGIKLFKRFGFKKILDKLNEIIQKKIDYNKKNELFDKLKRKQSMTRPILGSYIELNPNDYGIHRDLFLDGIREPVSTGYLMNIINREDTVLEVGANIGYYALLESKLCKKVYAVEPEERNMHNLKRNIKLNNVKNIETFELALGDRKGKAIMNINAKSNWHSFYPIEGTIGTKEVEMDTIDNFLKDKEKPTFVRMDVEGFEVNILKGMKETLKSLNRLFIEVHTHIMTDEETREFFDILKINNFVPEIIINTDRPGFSEVIPNEKIEEIYNGDYGCYKIFFIKKE